VAGALVLGILSIWITPGTGVTTGVGRVCAGLAFALQHVILSLAAHFVILRGDTSGVGDRIMFGGVRGDVFPPRVSEHDDHRDGPAALGRRLGPGRRVNSRRYTGRS
jgi:hypothetical protein